jgi:hypothetical protein
MSRNNAQLSPSEPIDTASSLSGSGMGCDKARINIVTPPIPNSATIKMSSVLSLITGYRRVLFATVYDMLKPLPFPVNHLMVRFG